MYVSITLYDVVGYGRSKVTLKDRCAGCVETLKSLCRYSEDITLFQILGVVYRIVIAALSSLVGLTLALLPLAEFLMLLVLYVVESIAWTLQEPCVSVAVAKVSIVFIPNDSYR